MGRLSSSHLRGESGQDSSARADDEDEGAQVHAAAVKVSECSYDHWHLSMPSCIVSLALTAPFTTGYAANRTLVERTRCLVPSRSSWRQKRHGSTFASGDLAEKLVGTARDRISRESSLANRNFRALVLVLKNEDYEAAVRYPSSRRLHGDSLRRHQP